MFEYVGGGWHFQADEVARCVRDGKKESALWGHNKSLLEMEIFDEVRIYEALSSSQPVSSLSVQVRRQGGYKFPDGIEKVL